MCGRFVASRSVEEVAEILEVDDVEVQPELVEPRWNVAPQAEILAVTCRLPKEPKQQPEGGGELTPGGAERPRSEVLEPGRGARLARRRLGLFHWGLVPSWAKDPSIGNRMFNARAETLGSKPADRVALAKRRCLVPADAFYEWEHGAAAPTGAAAQGTSGQRRRRQPWAFQSTGGELLTFAGLFEAWRPAEPEPESGEPPAWLLSCTIITTDANELVAPVHDRMPVVILPEDRDAWLAPGGLDDAELHALLRPAPAGALIAFRVAPEVNDARSEGPGLIRPVNDDPESSQRSAPPKEHATRPAPEGPEPAQASFFEAS